MDEERNKAVHWTKLRDSWSTTLLFVIFLHSDLKNLNNTSNSEPTCTFSGPEFPPAAAAAALSCTPTSLRAYFLDLKVQTHQTCSASETLQLSPNIVPKIMAKWVPNCIRIHQKDWSKLFYYQSSQKTLIASWWGKSTKDKSFPLNERRLWKEEPFYLTFYRNFYHHT